jgi:hypothetical protein
MSLIAILAQTVVDEASNWWEPGTPGSLDVGDLSAILGFLMAVAGAVYGTTRWWLKLMRTLVREEIEIATEPIHPNSNGGLSLADVARRTSDLDSEMKAMSRKVDRLSKSVNESNMLLIKFINDTTETPEVPAPKRSRSNKD